MTRTWTRRLLVSISVLAGIGVIWFLFGPLATWLGGDALDQLNPKDRLTAMISIRSQIGAAVGSTFVIGGLYYTARRFFIDRDRQYTDRFSTAVDHLSSPEETKRAGGARALERIMHDSPTDRNRVLKSLTGFLRHHTSTTDGPRRDDIAAAVEAIRLRGTSPRRFVEDPLDLADVHLAHTDLRGIALTRADLTNADLTGAALHGADLTAARLTDATLISTALDGAWLTHADLGRSRLARADLTDADLRQANLTEADLTGAALRGADLTSATLVNTDLRGTDLTHVVGLSSSQINRAQVDQRTRFPDGMEHPLQP